MKMENPEAMTAILSALELELTPEQAALLVSCADSHRALPWWRAARSSGKTFLGGRLDVVHWPEQLAWLAD
jgi:hypothetical protein